MDLTRYEPRKRPTQSRAKATFQAILDAAARILKKEGYDSANTNRIADEAGVSIGTLYDYFGSKEAIFAELKRRYLQVRFELSEAVFDEALVATPEESCRIMIEAQIRGAIATAPMEGVVTRAVPPEVLAQQRRDNQRAVDEVTLATYEKRPEKARRPRTTAARRLTRSITEVYLQHLMMNRPNDLEDPDLVEELTDMMVRYLVRE